MKRNDYIPPIPGQIKDGDDTRTNVLKLLGLENLIPLDIGKYNEGYYDPPIATVLVDGKEYSLKQILAAIGKSVKNGAFEYSEMPAADASTYDTCVVYVGASSTSYLRGHIYLCTRSGSGTAVSPYVYAWTDITPGAKGVESYTYQGVDLSTVFPSAAALMTALRAEDYSKIHIGDYWPLKVSGTYRDVGTYTCPAGTTLYSDEMLTTEAGTASAAVEAQWLSATACKVGSDKYCATSDCLAYYERTLSNAVFKMEVAAVNPYWRYGDSGDLTGNKPHLMLLSRDCIPHYLRMRKANTAWHVTPDPTNGIGVWQGTALYTTLNDPDYGLLKLIAATDIGAYIYAGPNGKGMRYYGEIRATEATTTSSGAWLDRGKLFLPTEDEIWGREILTIRSYQGQNQYPIFGGSRRHISKGIGDGGSRGYWWCMSAYAGNATHFCNVNYSGNPNNYGAVNAYGAPVGFLLA